MAKLGKPGPPVPPGQGVKGINFHLELRVLNANSRNTEGVIFVAMFWKNNFIERTVSRCSRIGLVRPLDGTPAQEEGHFSGISYFFVRASAPGSTIDNSHAGQTAANSLMEMRHTGIG